MEIVERKQSLYEQVMASPRISEEAKTAFAASYLCGKMDAAEKTDKEK
jgi:hypothetical protein